MSPESPAPSLSDAFDEVVTLLDLGLVEVQTHAADPWIALNPEGVTDEIRESILSIVELEETMGSSEADLRSLLQDSWEGPASEDPFETAAGLIMTLLLQMMLLATAGLLKLRGEETSDPVANAARFPALFAECKALMLQKNHDYGDSWRYMRIPSITDQMLVKALRLQQLEELDAQGKSSQVAEGREAELKDIFNYAVLEFLKYTSMPEFPDLPVRQFSKPEGMREES